MGKTSRTTCRHGSCDRPVDTGGYCRLHYQRMRSGADMNAPIRRHAAKVCKVEGCERGHQAKGFCYMHWQRWRKGMPLDAPVRRVAFGEWGQWRTKANGYVERRRRNPDTGAVEWQHKHRFVMELALGRPLLPGETVHHVDGNRSNNDLSNLQLRQGNHGSGVSYACRDCGSVNVTPTPLR